MIKVNQEIDMTIEEKYLELCKKYVNRKNDTCSPTLKTDQNLAYIYIALFKRRNKPQNLLNISRDTSNMASDTLST